MQQDNNKHIKLYSFNKIDYSTMKRKELLIHRKKINLKYYAE